MDLVFQLAERRAYFYFGYPIAHKDATLAKGIDDLIIATASATVSKLLHIS